MCGLDPDPAIALGGLRVGVSPLEMASAYGTIANGGVRVKPNGVLRVTDPAGKVLYEARTESKRAIPANIAATTSAMLHEVVEHGTGTAARTGRWAAGKTGTTQSYRDAWFIGWSGGVSTAVWVGHAKGQVPMLSVHDTKVTGGSFPAVIWSGIMADAAPGRAVPVASRSKLVRARICADSLQLAEKNCPNVVEMYLPADEVPKVRCDKH